LWSMCMGNMFAISRHHIQAKIHIYY